MCYNLYTKGEKVMEYTEIFEMFYKGNIALGKAMQKASEKVGVGNDNSRVD